ncbi:zinc-binding alcohol dehydrogenase family protein [Vogesella indigofera]|uniref:zinc-binding alcohol dehydrogenase family protein n=1 Tax=Vogesella indigofera TaxID=45465 RepID=UPI00234F0113|nr:zinc-binding alcohol dehydrogenase family protein [Vogesella indigofera]MDC7712221.1 zinc-binding alcohol dehydrogenase family protein [Vogesella indigofera]
MDTPLMPAIGVLNADDFHAVMLSVPTPGEHDLLIKVDAINVNPADYRVHQRKQDDGRLDILGWDAAGTVLACGSIAARHFRPGDAVYYAGDISRPGCNSAQQLVDWRLVARRPAGWSAEAAAALPLTGLTAWEALFEQMAYTPHRTLEQAQTLLVIGGAGGVGSIAIQLARLVPGLTVVATASREASAAWCRQMGAHHVIDHSRPLAPQLEQAGLPDVHGVLLLNRPDHYWQPVAELISPHGHIVNIVPFDRPPDLNLLMRKSVRYDWTYMFTRPLFQTRDMAKQGQALQQLTALAESGQIRTTRNEHLGALTPDTLRSAHQHLLRGDAIGKLTLTVS